MLRIKLPGGLLTAGAAARHRRAVERARARRQRAVDAPERPAPLAELRALPEVLRPLADGRARPPPARAATPSATSPAARSPASRTTSCSTSRRVIDEVAELLLRQPRLLEPAAQAQDLDLGVRRTAATRPRSTASRSSARPRGRARASPCSSAAGSRRCRASRASSASSCRKDEALPVLRALLDAWQEDLRYRLSRVKARIKFMVDDYGPRGCAPRSSSGSAARCADFTLPPRPATHADHLGVQPQKQAGPVLPSASRCTSA